MNHYTTISLVAVALLAGCETPTKTDARLYDGLNRYHRAIGTTSEEAQQYFDQGLVLCYGFNHDEAIRSFQRAAELDPRSPMPWWGIAYAHGMNINDQVMTDERYRLASEAVGEAEMRLTRATPIEAGLVRAIATRYSWPAPEEQRPLDEAYAESMQRLHERFPSDEGIAVLYAESLMNLQPWDYWTNEGAEKGRIAEVISTLEAVLTRNADHPGANHLYIHAVEASQDPQRGVESAERLEYRIPGAGHLVHMPSHIYVRVGRYSDAADVNKRAVAADRRYFQAAPEPGLYAIYYAHNLHFLAYASMMEGNYQTALLAARDMEREIPEQALRDFGGLIEGIMATTFHVMIRFGKWEEILEEPERPDYRMVTNAVRHYARGIAFSALNEPEKARAEIEAFEAAADAIPDEWFVFNNRVDTILPIAHDMLEGELAFREGRHEDAFAALRRAVEAEDALVYDEPPGWMLPVRHPLGAFLMSAGRYAEAEEVYREDQRRNRGNGWSLLGLQQALEAQGKHEDAERVGRQLARAWRRADTATTSSCLCEPRENWDG
jgi:tetratricopeptide (TPR) repeat protein